jgi:hypothetical protein
MSGAHTKKEMVTGDATCHGKAPLGEFSNKKREE